MHPRVCSKNVGLRVVIHNPLRASVRARTQNNEGNMLHVEATYNKVERASFDVDPSMPQQHARDLATSYFTQYGNEVKYRCTVEQATHTRIDDSAPQHCFPLGSSPLLLFDNNHLDSNNTYPAMPTLEQLKSDDMMWSMYKGFTQLSNKVDTLTTNNKSLSDRVDHLTTSNNTLTASNNTLTASNNTLTASNSTLTASNKSLSDQVVTFKTQLTMFSQQYIDDKYPLVVAVAGERICKGKVMAVGTKRTGFVMLAMEAAGKARILKMMKACNLGSSKRDIDVFTAFMDANMVLRVAIMHKMDDEELQKTAKRLVIAGIREYLQDINPVAVAIVEALANDPSACF